MPKIKLDLGLKISLIIAVSVFVLMSFGSILGSASLSGMITSTAGESYGKIAGVIAASIATAVNREIELVRADASGDILRSAARDSGARLAPDAKSAQGDFDGMNKRWAAASSDSQLVTAYTENAASAKLKSIMAADKDVVEIALTDRSGSLVAATRKVAYFYEADQDWWRKAFNGGKGKAAIGGILPDEETGTWCIPFAVPVRDEAGNVVGIYKALVDIRAFFKPLEDFKVGRTGNALLVDDKGYLVYYPQSKPFSNKFCDYKELQKALENRSKWLVLRTVYMHTPKAFAAYAEVTNPALAEGGVIWRVFIVQDAKEVYGALGAFTARIAFFAVLLVILMSFAAMFIFAGIFKKPLGQLEEGFERLSRGDLDYEVEVKTGDEVEHLAEAYNRMREALKKVTVPIAAVERETQARQRAEHKVNAISTDFASQSAVLREEIEAVRNEMRLLAEQGSGKGLEKQKHAAEALEVYIAKMAKTVNELADSAAIERGMVEFIMGPVDFRSMVKEAIFVLEPKIREKGLDLKLNMPGNKIMVDADEARLKQVFLNIVEGAIRFTERGYIEIAIKELKDTVECSITDTGAGIPQDAISSVFERAERFSSIHGRKARGGGLELFVAKGVIEGHKGTISVESELGKRTKFVFTLPKITSAQKPV